MRTSPASGLIVLRDIAIGELPPTPRHPTDPIEKDDSTETALLAVAEMLGEVVGYGPEHGGCLVQNIVPVKGQAAAQISTSSHVELKFHTEAAFHPHRPRYILLLCLRGDQRASTTVSAILGALPFLSPCQIATLLEPRFRCYVDQSYLHGRSNVLGPPVPVLSGDLAKPTMIFDEDLMVGTDPEADDALRSLGIALRCHHTGVVLEAGDLAIIDNAVAVHGRSSFEPRFDGTDRWLQRAFVVESLAPSAGERSGRVITTNFGA